MIEDILKEVDRTLMALNDSFIPYNTKQSFSYGLPPEDREEHPVQYGLLIEKDSNGSFKGAFYYFTPSRENIRGLGILSSCHSFKREEAINLGESLLREKVSSMENGLRVIFPERGKFIIASGNNEH